MGSVREHNEDHLAFDESLGLYVVCDGMGGHSAGDVASRTAAEALTRYLTERRGVLDAIRRGEQPHEEAAALLSHGIQSASAQVHQLGVAQPERRGAGTTCTAVLVLGDKAVMGHVGDSRLYLQRGGKVYQLSEDHTFINDAIKRGLLTPEQAAVSEYSNLVTRAVGPSPSVLVDTLVFDVVAGDTLLLSSDGLHNYVKTARELAEHLTSDDLEAKSSELIDIANARGGADNITAILLRLTAGAPESDAQSARANRITQDLDALAHIGLFRDLDMKELVKVGAACHAIEKSEGDWIVREGETSDTLFVLSSGAVEVSRAGRVLTTLKSGEHFGEMAILSRRPRSASVRALSPCRLLCIEQVRLHELFHADAALAAKFLWKLAQGLSLRLDDITVAPAPAAPTDSAEPRLTHPQGLLPSPFESWSSERSWSS